MADGTQRASGRLATGPLLQVMSPRSSSGLGGATETGFLGIDQDVPEEDGVQRSRQLELRRDKPCTRTWSRTITVEDNCGTEASERERSPRGARAFSTPLHVLHLGGRGSVEAEASSQSL